MAAVHNATGQGMTVNNAQFVYHCEQVTIEEFEFLYISNNTPDTITVKWTREETALQPNWYTTVCDNQGCFLPEVATESFFLEPGLTGWLKLSLYPQNTPGYGSTKLTLEAVDRPDIEPVVVDYQFYVNGVTAVHQPVAPNKINTYYSNGKCVIGGLPDNFSGVASVYSPDGRLLQQTALEKKHSGDAIFSTGYLNTGFYVIYLGDNFGTLFSGKLVVTNP